MALIAVYIQRSIFMLMRAHTWIKYCVFLHTIKEKSENYLLTSWYVKKKISKYYVYSLVCCGSGIRSKWFKVSACMLPCPRAISPQGEAQETCSPIAVQFCQMLSRAAFLLSSFSLHLASPCTSSAPTCPQLHPALYLPYHHLISTFLAFYIPCAFPQNHTKTSPQLYGN